MKNTNVSENWYAPLKKEDKKKETKKRRKIGAGWWFGGAGLLLLLLIVGSSVLFARQAPGTQDNTQFPFSFEDKGMPGDFKDFFDSYYTTTQTDETNVNLPVADKLPDFKIELVKPADKELSLHELYEKCSPSIVAITGYVEDMPGYYWGTGIIISGDGLILTNCHIIEGCDSAVVTLADNTEYDALLVGADSVSDVAILKIDAKNLPAVELGDSTQVSVGDHVAAIGNPLGDTFRATLTDGIISAIGRGIDYNGHTMNLIQTNTAINEGNSGGALFNMYGQVIGVTNMKMMSSYSSIEGIGFAIPTATVQEIANSLLKFGEVRGRAVIGITVGSIPDEALEEYNLPEGLYISAVTAGSDAEAKGIRPGDIITALNGEPVAVTDDIVKVKDGLSVGDSMNFTIWREGESFDVEVVLMDMNDLNK